MMKKLSDTQKKKFEFCINSLGLIFHLSLFIYSTVYLVANLDIMKHILEDNEAQLYSSIGFFIALSYFCFYEFIGFSFYFTKPIFDKVFSRGVENGKSDN